MHISGPRFTLFCQIFQALILFPALRLFRRLEYALLNNKALCLSDNCFINKQKCEIYQRFYKKDLTSNFFCPAHKVGRKRAAKA